MLSGGVNVDLVGRKTEAENTSDVPVLDVIYTNPVSRKPSTAAFSNLKIGGRYIILRSTRQEARNPEITNNLGFLVVQPAETPLFKKINSQSVSLDAWPPPPFPRNSYPITIDIFEKTRDLTDLEFASKALDDCLEYIIDEVRTFLLSPDTSPQQEQYLRESFELFFKKHRSVRMNAEDVAQVAKDLLDRWFTSTFLRKISRDMIAILHIDKNNKHQKIAFERFPRACAIYDEERSKKPSVQRIK